MAISYVCTVSDDGKLRCFPKPKKYHKSLTKQQISASKKRQAQAELAAERYKKEANRSFVGYVAKGIGKAVAALPPFGCGLPEIEELTEAGRMIELAHRLRDKGHFKEALELYEKFVVSYPNHTRVGEIIYELAWTYETELKDYKNAVKWYKVYVEKFPNGQPNNPIETEYYYLRIAEIYLTKLKDFAQAIEAYKSYLRKFPNSKDAQGMLYNIGTIYLDNLSDYKNAIEAYKEVVWKYPSSNYAELSAQNIGYIYHKKLNDYYSAITAYTDFINKFPNSKNIENVYLTIAEIYHFDIKDYTKAINEYEGFLKKFPNSSQRESALKRLASTYNYLADQEIKSGSAGPSNYYKAISFYKKSFEYYNDAAKYSSNSANKSFVIEQAELALISIAQIYWFKLKQYSTAVTEYKGFLTKFPNSSREKDVLYWIAYISDTELSDKVTALNYYKKFIGKYPNDSISPQVQWSIGLIYELYYKDYQQAVKEYKKLISDYPNSTYVINAQKQLNALCSKQGVNCN